MEIIFKNYFIQEFIYLWLDQFFSPFAKKHMAKKYYLNFRKYSFVLSSLKQKNFLVFSFHLMANNYLLNLYESYRGHLKVFKQLNWMLMNELELYSNHIFFWLNSNNCQSSVLFSPIFKIYFNSLSHHFLPLHHSH